MTDTRLPERWLQDRRLARLSCEAYRFFMHSLMWSVSNRTEGLIEQADLDFITYYEPRLVSELVDREIWAVKNAGWYIVDFHDTQTSKEQLAHLENARRYEREKKRRQRAEKRAQEAVEQAPLGDSEANVSLGTSGGRPEGTGPGTIQERKGLRPFLSKVSEEQGPRNSTSKAKSGTSPARAREGPPPPPDAVFEAATAERGLALSGPVSIGASRLVATVIPAGAVTDAARTILRIEASALLVAGHSEDDVAECLRVWLANEKLGPNALKCCMTEVLKRRHNGHNGHAMSPVDQKAMEWLTGGDFTRGTP